MAKSGFPACEVHVGAEGFDSTNEDEHKKTQSVMTTLSVTLPPTVIPPWDVIPPV